MKAVVRAVSDPRDVSIWADQYRNRSNDRAEHRELPYACIASIDALNAFRPSSDIERAGISKVEQHRARTVQQAEHAR